MTLYRYALPLTAPLRLGDDTWRHRRGLLLRLETSEGFVGWGDAAPLPGFSPESLDDVVASARMMAPRLIGLDIPPTGGLNQAVRALPLAADGLPSLQFATESALVALIATKQDTDLASVLGTPRSTVALNALISSPADEGPAQAARMREQGYRAVKVKVGRRPIREEAGLLAGIRHELGDEIMLRADANRAWSLQDALAFAEETRDLQLAYVEEPLADPTQLSTFVAQADLPVALDETTRERGPDVLRDGPPVSAVVLKPTLLGGLRATQEWMRAAQAHSVTPVLSAAYESGIGLRMLLALAAVGPDVPVGLSTYDRLADDVLCSPLSLEGPTVEVRPHVATSVSVHRDRLERIDTFSS